MVINMRFAFNLLIISILAVCTWFFIVSVESKAYYRKVFRFILFSALIMYLNRLLCISMEEGYLTGSDILLTTERLIHYMFTLEIYTLYAFFIFCLFDQFHYFSGRKKLLFFMPCIITAALIITSPWTHLIFWVKDGVCHKGVLFWLLVLVRGGYAITATIKALLKRNLMIKVFGQCVILLAVFAGIQAAVFFISGNETMYYSTLIVNVVVFVLAITMVEFYKDDLTELFNQKAFKQYVSKELEKQRQRAVYLIKLKNYEYLSDNYNKYSICEVIKKLAEYIKEYTMLSSIYYLGGGRFCIIQHKSDKLNEKEFFDRLEERFCVPFEIDGSSVNLSLFAAVMNMESGKINKDNFYKYFAACDEIRYRSNDALEIVQADTFNIDQIQRYRDVEDAIERGLVEKEFTMFYQPIISAETGRVISAEALIRLKDRVLGFISPEEFIPISETNGTILEISEFVIDSVFKFVSGHDITQMGMEFIEMNLSVIQCMDENLNSKLEYYIEKYHVDPKRINLEITETTNFDEEKLKQQLEKIKKLGFSFSLDDYGTGYSNLVRVLEYPVDVIKLDKSIIWAAFDDRDSFVTVKNLIAMFHDVRRKLVAEGVENQTHADRLKELGCDYLQGYFYSKPVNQTEFVDFVNKFNNKI